MRCGRYSRVDAGQVASRRRSARSTGKRGCSGESLLLRRSKAELAGLSHQSPSTTSECSVVCEASPVRPCPSIAQLGTTLGNVRQSSWLEIASLVHR
jgi:hypothetical protein